MFGLGPWEIVLLAVAVFVLFGYRKVPEIGKGLGKGIKNFKDALREGRREIEVTPREIPEDESRAKESAGKPERNE